MNVSDKICAICSEESKKPHQVHYGGLACFSCRAFFRRAHQKTKCPQFKCKKANSCEVTPKTRRKCQKCRYDLCLRAGMRAEAVLTDDQKMVRFRNALKKKKDSSGQSRQSRLLSRKTRRHLNDSNEEEISSSDDSMLSDYDETEIEPSVANVILSWYDKSHSLVKFDPEFMQDLIAYHKGDLNVLLRCSSWIDHMSKLESQYKMFARLNEVFAKIPSEADKSLLVSRNAPLYVQLVLMMYFSQDTGHRQIQCLLGPQAPNLSLELKKVTMAEVHRDLSLFKRDPPEFHEDLLNKINVKVLAVIAHVLLFNYDDSVSFQEPDVIGQLRSEVECNFPNLLQDLGVTEAAPEISTLFQACQLMAKFYAKNLNRIHASKIENDAVMEDQPMNVMPIRQMAALTNSFLFEEDQWLSNQISLLDSAFASVNLGEEIVKEAVMYSFEVPLSKHFMPNCLRAMLERVRRVMLFHPEFTSLSSSNQQKLFERNCLLGAALIGSKCEAFDKGSDQHYFMLGRNDVQWYKDTYRGVYEDTQLKKVTMGDANQFSKILSPQMVQEHARLSCEIGSAVKNDVAFKLSCLMLLFSGVEGMPEIEKLAKSYAHAIQRQQTKNAKTGEMFYSSLLRCVDNIQKLSEIMKKLATV